MPTIPLRVRLTLAAALSLALPALAAPAIDPDIAIESLAHAYSSAPIDERIDIRVTIVDSAREESVTVHMRPDGNYALELGDITLWTDGPRFLAVHRHNAATVFTAQRPEGRAQWGVLQSILPPILAPQLSLVHGIEKGFSSPISYTRNIVWKSCETDETVNPPVVRMKGEGDANTIDLIADQNLTRILRMIVRIESSRTRIDMTFHQEPQGLEPAPLGVDINGRTTVESITDLAPAAGDLKPGAKLPDFVLLSPVEPPPPPITGPAVVLLYRSNALEPFHWVEAARRFSIARSYATSFPIIVYTLGETSRQLKEKLEAWSMTLAPDPVRYTISPSTTIDRFAPGHPGVFVTIDAENTITSVVPLTNEDDNQALTKLNAANQ